MMAEMSDDVVGELLSAFLKLGALQLRLGIITTEAMPTFGSRANQSIGALDDLAAAAAPLKAFNCLLRGHGHRGLHIADAAARHGDKNS
jgi:hypothetical protein